MNVVAFNGSPKAEGNTWNALKMVADVLIDEGIRVDIIHVGRNVVRGCIACNWCKKNGKGRCVFDDDGVNDWIQQIREAEGILLGSPVYFSGINGTMKSFLDRAGYVLAGEQAALRYKVGAPVITVRRSGGVAALDQLNHYISYFEMIAPASNYWSVIHGMQPGESLKDEEGKQIMRILGRNMAWLMKVIRHGQDSIPKPEIEEKIGMNFIR